MERFVELYLVLAGNAAEHVKVAALDRYFRDADATDAAWTAFMLVGHHKQRVISSARLRSIALAVSGLPAWLLEASQTATGDLGETAALVVGPGSGPVVGTLAHWMEQRIGALAGLPQVEIESRLRGMWAELPLRARWVVNRIATAKLHVRSGDKLVARCLSARTGVAEQEIVRRLAGTWQPSATAWAQLTARVPVSTCTVPTASLAASREYRVHALLLYAQPGRGRHASLHADCTFAVWHHEALMPFTKAPAALPDTEARELDAWIRAHTRERFGPVRSVEPLLVFELAFDAVELSTRHKCGLAVTGTRVVGWRRDLAPEDAGTLDALRAIAGASRSAPLER